jgi:hypothetical protein
MEMEEETEEMGRWKGEDDDEKEPRGHQNGVIYL